MRIFIFVSFLLSAQIALAVEPFADDLPSQITTRTTSLLEGEKFKELEDIGSKYRTAKSRLPSSTWKLDFYYRGGVMCANDKPKAVLATVCRAHLEKWKQAMPISATPLIFLVDNYYQQACLS